MKQSWDRLLSLLPRTLAMELKDADTDGLRELRLRLGAGMELNYGDRQTCLTEPVSKEDIAYVINAASRYSPWQSETMARGYLTAAGGYRIGICGAGISREGHIQGIRNPQSLCIRMARDVKGIGEPFRCLRRSLLLVGPPCSGKTTLLRDIARKLSEKDTVAVVDEREELFPEGFQRGKRMDVLSLCPKAEGMDMVLRTMGPEWICMDEITKEEDAEAIYLASNCGVGLLATAHALDLRDLEKRMVYRKLLDARIFENIVVLRKDNTYSWERKEAWN